MKEAENKLNLINVGILNLAEIDNGGNTAILNLLEKRNENINKTADQLVLEIQNYANTLTQYINTEKPKRVWKYSNTEIFTSSPEAPNYLKYILG
jgi:hypothetical protein